MISQQLHQNVETQALVLAIISRMLELGISRNEIHLAVFKLDGMPRIVEPKEIWGLGLQPGLFIDSY
jgi:NOL1/NOP2/fmu family ribosome biogenesis protein